MQPARLYEWLRVYVRFVLAFTMFTYGVQKVFGAQLQFPAPTLDRLVQPAVMANVVALNFCYDVSVKLFSAHLLAMAIFLTLPDLRRLRDFFLAHPRFRPGHAVQGSAARRPALAVLRDLERRRDRGRRRRARAGRSVAMAARDLRQPAMVRGADDGRPPRARASAFTRCCVARPFRRSA